MADEETQETQDDEATQATESASGRTFTQADVDRIAERERKRAKAQALKEFEDQQKQASMTETQKLAKERDDARAAADAAMQAANARLIQADARVAALDLGAKPERVAAILRLADLSDVEVDAKGVAATDQIKDALSAVLNDYPEFKAGAEATDTTTTRTSTVGGGSNPGGAGNKSLSLDEQYEAARKAGNVPVMIAIKRQIAERTTR